MVVLHIMYYYVYVLCIVFGSEKKGVQGRGRIDIDAAVATHLFPRNAESNSITKGRYGAVKFRTPKICICTCSFLLPHTYSIMKVKLLPRKFSLRNGAKQSIMPIPKRKNITNAALRLCSEKRGVC